MTRELSGEPVATEIRRKLRPEVRRLRDAGTVPTLGTVLMSSDPADRRFMDLKHEACSDLELATRDVRLDPDDPAPQLYDAVDHLSDDPEVDGVFVQTPLPDQVDSASVRRRIAPEKDVDCFHPENVGRLVAGYPRFVPATPAAVIRLLEWYDVPTNGRDVVVVGRSNVIGKPLANYLLRDGTPGNATVTVCHSRTRDLGAKTREADIVVTAAGVPGLVDRSMLSPGVVVIDVSANRVPRDRAGDPEDPGSSASSDGNGGSERPAGRDSSERDRESTVVGDVDENAREVADAITPVPGGVGPVTLATLAANVVRAAERTTDDDRTTGRSPMS